MPVSGNIDELKKIYPEKFPSENKIFSHIHGGDRIFIGTGCGEPRYLVSALIDYVQLHPKAFFDTEVFQIWALGIVPYSEEKFKPNFRHNTFFIGNSNRKAINAGLADYTPVLLSQVPDLFRRGLVPIDVAMIQTSPPDKDGSMSLGISVDITKSAAEHASLVIVQPNAHMPRVHGDTFINIDDVDFIIPHDEPLMEYATTVSDEIAQRIGKYVARIIEDGDTIQVGYGSITNAILSNLRGKQHLGVHTELLTDGIIDLMRRGAVDNTKKTINRGKTVASFCMGRNDTHHYIHDNPGIEFRPIDYTNNPLVIAQHNCMVAINSALEIDLTGQATAESIGKTFYSGIGGSADFMRGTNLAPKGKTILALESTAANDTTSRIVPSLKEGAGVTLNRGDVRYVVTEYGIAYLYGKNIRERAMELIAIAHPKFRSWLIEEAKNLNLVYKDQLFVPGKGGEYPEELEVCRTTKTGLQISLRPVKISDEPLLKDFFYSLSDQSIYLRFFSRRTSMPHEDLQKFVVIDYTEKMAILAVCHDEEKEEVVGVGRYFIEKETCFADLALVIRDDWQNQGIGKELLAYLVCLAKKQGLLGVIAEVLIDNKPMLQLLRIAETMGFDTRKKLQAGVFTFKILFDR